MLTSAIRRFSSALQARAQLRQELRNCPDFGVRELLRLERVIKRTEHWRLLENEVAKYAGLDFGDPYDALKFLKINFWLRANILRAVSLNLHRQPRMKILDLGCGSAMLPFVCRFWGHEAVGLDRSLDQFSPAEKIVYGSLPEILAVPVQRKDIQAFVPIELNQSYDFICAFMVCFNQHQRADEWQRDEWEFCIRDLCRHVNPSGKVYLLLNEHTAKYGELRYYDEQTSGLFQRFGHIDARGSVTIFRDRVVGTGPKKTSYPVVRVAGARLPDSPAGAGNSAPPPLLSPRRAIDGSS